MMLLIPIPNIHPITDKVNGQTIMMLGINNPSITGISECPETGNAVILYLMAKPIVTCLPFIDMVHIFNNQGAVEFTAKSYCMKVSPALKKYLNSVEPNSTKS